MIRRNVNLKLTSSGKIVYKEKTKTILKKAELNKLIEDIENFEDEKKKNEALFALESGILSGRRIVLKKDRKIQIYTNTEARGLVGPMWIISDNKELYSLLKDLVLS